MIVIFLIKSVTVSLKDGIWSVSCLQKKKNLIQTLISESKTESNVDSKRSKLLNTVTISKGTAEVRYMKYLMKAFKNDCENVGETKSNTTLVRKENNKEFGLPTQLNVTHYTLSETIKHIEDSKPNTIEFYNTVKKQNSRFIICSKATLYRHQKSTSQQVIFLRKTMMVLQEDVPN